MHPFIVIPVISTILAVIGFTTKNKEEENTSSTESIDDLIDELLYDTDVINDYIEV